MALKEAKIILFIVALLTALGFLVSPWLGGFGIVIFIAVLAFFRDPHRTIPSESGLVVSSADGLVVRVDQTEEPVFTNKPMKRVAVFLSVLDVHINRAPCDGTLVDTQYQRGAFLDARDPNADLKNESLNWLLQTERGNVVVRQIAGLIARRIVGWKTPGIALQRGERIGMIKFGSRTDVYLPTDCEICVKEGDRVKGGETVIARFPAKSA